MKNIRVPKLLECTKPCLGVQGSGRYNHDAPLSLICSLSNLLHLTVRDLLLFLFFPR